VNEATLLALTAVAFALVTGANDGATLVAINLPNPAIRPLAAVALLAVAVAVIPLVVGARVAETLARGLVSFEGGGGEGHFLGAVVAALAVVLVLSRRGLPTSLTLALLGAIVGTGLGLGLAVSWATVIAVVLIGLAAPVVSSIGGLLTVRAFGHSPVGHAWTQLRALGVISFLLQSIAYAANDGQKMLAVLAIALGLGANGRIVVQPGPQILLGALFALGTLAGIERLAGRLGRGILPVRALHVVASEIASATSVLVSPGLGAPVSMTHASTAALIGAGVSETIWRVRWEQAIRIAGAWVLTLPAAALAGALVALVLRFRA
jgi:PiT family inorganic phosphate transporter